MITDTRIAAYLRKQSAPFFLMVEEQNHFANISHSNALNIR